METWSVERSAPLPARRRRRWFRLALAAVVTATGGAVAVVTLPAGADTRPPPGVRLTITDADEQSFESQQRFFLRFTDTWTDERGYQITWLPYGQGGAFQSIFETGPRSGSGSVVTHTAWVPDLTKTHCFVVRVWNSLRSNNSAPVCAAMEAPAAPESNDAVWSSSESVELVFKRSERFESPYRVYGRHRHETQWRVWPAKQWGTQPGGKARYRVEGVPADRTYCFRVTSVHALGESPPSEEACRDTLPSPTAGWRKLDNSNYTIIKPYNLNASDRWSYSPGEDIHTTRVYATDRPHLEGSPTSPRTEVRWDGLDYRRGMRMWEGDVWVTRGTDGAALMQIFREDQPDDGAAVDYMLRVYDEDGGTLRDNDRDTPAYMTGVYERWINVKVEHNATLGRIRVYLDDVLVHTVADYGDANRRMKNGVYGVDGTMSKAAFHDVTIWQG